MPQQLRHPLLRHKTRLRRRIQGEIILLADQTPSSCSSIHIRIREINMTKVEICQRGFGLLVKVFVQVLVEVYLSLCLRSARGRGCCGREGGGVGGREVEEVRAGGCGLVLVGLGLVLMVLVVGLLMVLKIGLERYEGLRGVGMRGAEGDWAEIVDVGGVVEVAMAGEEVRVGAGFSEGLLAPRSVAGGLAAFGAGELAFEGR